MNGTGSRSFDPARRRVLRGLLAGLVAASPAIAWARDRDDDDERAARRAARDARRRSDGGRVLRTRRNDDGDYRVRVLKDGRVRDVPVRDSR